MQQTVQAIKRSSNLISLAFGPQFAIRFCVRTGNRIGPRCCSWKQSRPDVRAISYLSLRGVRHLLTIPFEAKCILSVVVEEVNLQNACQIECNFSKRHFLKCFVVFFFVHGERSCEIRPVRAADDKRNCLERNAHRSPRSGIMHSILNALFLYKMSHAAYPPSH